MGNELPVQVEHADWLQEVRQRLINLGYKDRDRTPFVHDDLGMEAVMYHRRAHALVSVAVTRRRRRVSSRWTVDECRREEYHVSLWIDENDTVEAYITDTTELPRLLMLMDITNCSTVHRLSEAVFDAAVSSFEATIRQLVWECDSGFDMGEADRTVRRAFQDLGLYTLRHLLTWAWRQPYERCECGATAPTALFRVCAACGRKRCLSCGAGDLVRLADEEFEHMGWACFRCMSAGRVTYPRLVE